MACPLRMDPEANDGCCRWREFVDDFEQNFARWFDTPPTLKLWQAARRDWRKGNTGYEAAHNAQRRAREAAAAVSREAPVHLIGRHYAAAGSAIVARFAEISRLIKKAD